MFMGFRRSGAKNAAPQRKRRRRSSHSVAEAFVPTVPLSAVFCFAVVGFGGALFLSYSRFPTAETTTISARSTTSVPVYSARAVPRDPEKPAPLEQSVSAPDRGTVAQAESRAVEPAESSRPRLLASEPISRGFNGFDGFTNSNAPNTYLALGEVPLGVGLSANSISSGHSAPDSENLSSVPEPSTWLAGAALVTLVGARWLRARWRRSPRSSR